MVSAELAPTAEQIKKWLRDNSHIIAIEPLRLYQSLNGKVSWRDILRVLSILHAAGEIDLRYRVRFADGTLSEEEHSRKEDFAECVFDSAFQPVDVTADNIVPVYAASAVTK